MSYAQAIIAALAVAVVTTCALVWWGGSVTRQVMETAQYALASPLEVTDVVQAKWLWDDPETPAVDPIEIVITMVQGMTFAEFREQVRQAKIEFPPYVPPEGDR